LPSVAAAIDFNCCRRSIAQILIGFFSLCAEAATPPIYADSEDFWLKNEYKSVAEGKGVGVGVRGGATPTRIPFPRLCVCCAKAAKINYDIMIYKISRKWCGLFSLLFHHFHSSTSTSAPFTYLSGQGRGRGQSGRVWSPEPRLCVLLPQEAVSLARSTM